MCICVEIVDITMCFVLELKLRLVRRVAGEQLVIKAELQNYDHTQRKAAVKKEQKEKIVMRPSRNPQNDC